MKEWIWTCVFGIASWAVGDSADGGCLRPGQVWETDQQVVLMDTEDDACHDYRTGIGWDRAKGEGRLSLGEARSYCQKLGKRLPTISEIENLGTHPVVRDAVPDIFLDYVKRHLSFFREKAFVFADRPTDSNRPEYYGYAFPSEEKVLQNEKGDVEFRGSVVCVKKLNGNTDSDGDFVPDVSDQCILAPAKKTPFLTESRKYPVRVFTRGRALLDGRIKNLRGCLPDQEPDLDVRTRALAAGEQRLRAVGEQQLRERGGVGKAENLGDLASDLPKGTLCGILGRAPNTYRIWEFKGDKTLYSTPREKSESHFGPFLGKPICFIDPIIDTTNYTVDGAAKSREHLYIDAHRVTNASGLPSEMPARLIATREFSTEYGDGRTLPANPNRGRWK